MLPMKLNRPKCFKTDKITEKNVSGVGFKVRKDSSTSILKKNSRTNFQLFYVFLLHFSGTEFFLHFTTRFLRKLGVTYDKNFVVPFLSHHCRESNFSVDKK